MPDLHFNVFDWVVIGIIAMSSIMGFMRGIIREVFTAVSILGAAIAVLFYLRNSESFNLMPFLQPAWLQVVVSAGAVFAIVFVGLGFATSSIAALLHKSAEISALDRGAGLAYGFARAALIAVLSVVLVRHVTPPRSRPPGHHFPGAALSAAGARGTGAGIFHPGSQARGRGANQGRDQGRPAGAAIT
jgi:uncharacterized membrane protein required for colicin V production